MWSLQPCHPKPKAIENTQEDELMWQLWESLYRFPIREYRKAGVNHLWFVNQVIEQACPSERLVPRFKTSTATSKSLLWCNLSGAFSRRTRPRLRRAGDIPPQRKWNWARSKKTLGLERCIKTLLGDEIRFCLGSRVNFTPITEQQHLIYPRSGKTEQVSASNPTTVWSEGINI